MAKIAYNKFENLLYAIAIANKYKKACKIAPICECNPVYFVRCIVTITSLA